MDRNRGFDVFISAHREAMGEALALRDRLRNVQLLGEQRGAPTVFLRDERMGEEIMEGALRNCSLVVVLASSSYGTGQEQGDLRYVLSEGKPFLAVKRDDQLQVEWVQNALNGTNWLSWFEEREQQPQPQPQHQRFARIEVRWQILRRIRDTLEALQQRAPDEEHPRQPWLARTVLLALAIVILGQAIFGVTQQSLLGQVGESGHGWTNLQVFQRLDAIERRLEHLEYVDERLSDVEVALIDMEEVMDRVRKLEKGAHAWMAVEDMEQRMRSLEEGFQDQTHLRDMVHRVNALEGQMRACTAVQDVEKRVRKLEKQMKSRSTVDCDTQDTDEDVVGQLVTLEVQMATLEDRTSTLEEHDEALASLREQLHGCEQLGDVVADQAGTCYFDSGSCPPLNVEPDVIVEYPHGEQVSTALWGWEVMVWHPSGGAVAAALQSPGIVLRFHCSRDHYVSGHISTTCLRSLQWSHQPPKCIPLTNCRPSEYVEAPASESTDRICATCPPGTFSDSENAAKCSVVRRCSPGEYMLREATPTSNRECKQCTTRAETITRPLGTKPETDVDDWADLVLAANGVFYGIPAHATSVLAYNPNGTVHAEIDVSFYGDSWKWSAGVLADGLIFGIPYDAAAVLVIHPSSDSISDISVECGRTACWKGGALAGNGKIYATPHHADEVLIIDPVALTVDTTTIIGLGLGWKWAGATLAQDGRIYCAPFDRGSLLVIDPTTNTAEEWGVMVLDTNAAAFSDIITAANGLLFAIPFNARFVAVADPKTRDFAGISGLSWDGSKWGAARLDRFGRIVAMPYRANSVLLIDPDTGTIAYNSTTTNGCLGAATTRDGIVHCIPNHTQDAMLLVDYPCDSRKKP
ncbi:hypothetical protein PTSG_09788 [Salpingoeca rosetta]|uniref:TNFR-Cys domain-containing protein n=1 Tax=Salpingoeca rosetta (strain ATCC 50818 / BSB-021) TaxID=946362 RepID=F2UP23_SALR5|nr:uncharacterized protein PTSG_09788 [Salpingoeca rosetta]EGD79378.1 hypothetical protein PTSG_09788 [Salpingoeca rosetta]|eukprot:XP_004989147.1 hypothetical protein PTSG_09788 [Salpingoeca rosetta]